MILKYLTGEEIRKGDRVLYHGEPAEVEFAVTDASDPETEWYFGEFGGGLMIVQPVEPKSFGSVFISACDIDDTEDLEFVSRADSPTQSPK
jgi:hypothetical protein